MKTKILISSIILSISGWAMAQRTAAEEALILNQELQFLEDSARSENSSSSLGTSEVQKSRAMNESSLERTYFKAEPADAVRTRTAAPKRRFVD